MHFFYLDETGCTGADLTNLEQPIFVIGGISVTDEAWRTTNQRLRSAIEKFFNHAIAPEFELHASDLINGEGPFQEHEREDRNALAHRLLDIIAERKHAIHFVGIDKAKLAKAVQGAEHDIINCSIPYLLGFNYLVSYIERYVRDVLGKSARGMIILDQKDLYHSEIDRLTHFRRYEVANARQLKWLVEFSYPVDSVRHPMVQVSDLVIYLVRKFLECENGYRPKWGQEAKNFYASCYDKIIKRIKWNTLISASGAEEKGAHGLLGTCHSTHRRQWRRHYKI
jgi:hypothetical protein